MTIKEYIKIYKKRILIICIISFFILNIIIMKASTPGNSDQEEIIIEEIISEEIIEENIECEPAEEIRLYIDIKGEVNNPGVYEITEGNRVIDVINRAGGLTEDADSNTINLSKMLTDQMIIFIPRKDELSVCYFEEELLIEEVPIVEDSELPQAPPGAQTSINFDTIEELEKLPGIGNSKAQAIVQYRSENGFFTSKEDLKNVPGIGDATYENIKNYIQLY